jgi:methionyl-tRNA synthetase
MPATVKITLPKLSANTKPFANALKLSMAAQVTGAKLVETAGEAVTCVVSNDVALTDANAALK